MLMCYAAHTIKAQRQNIKNAPGNFDSVFDEIGVMCSSKKVRRTCMDLYG